MHFLNVRWKHSTMTQNTSSKLIVVRIDLTDWYVHITSIHLFIITSKCTCCAKSINKYTCENWGLDTEREWKRKREIVGRWDYDVYLICVSQYNKFWFCGLIPMQSFYRYCIKWMNDDIFITFSESQMKCYWNHWTLWHHQKSTACEGYVKTIIHTHTHTWALNTHNKYINKRKISVFWNVTTKFINYIDTQIAWFQSNECIVNIINIVHC